MRAINEAENNKMNFNIILDGKGLLNVGKQKIKARTMKNNLELFFLTNKLSMIQLHKKLMSLM